MINKMIRPALLVLLGMAFCVNTFAKAQAYYYQLKIYHYKGAVQEKALDDFLQGAYLPALHRAGIPNVGVFKSIAKDTSEQLTYVFIPFKKIDAFLNLSEVLDKDAAYQSAGKDYINAPYDKSPYNRIESILLKAFKGMLQPALPILSAPKNERVYELRSYEGATESLSLNKIGMFNDAEIAIFTKLNFNTVFYAQVISGTRMPNLMYLTTYNSKADREAHWAAFSPEYKKISVLPQYQHNNAKSVILFLYPVDYSDI